MSAKYKIHLAQRTGTGS